VLRTRLATVFVVLAAALAAAAPAAAGGRATDADTLERPLLAAINDFRRSQGLGRLKSSPALSRAALAHANAMAAGGFFAHESADGSPFWKRVARYYPSTGFARWTVGENLLWSGGDLSPERALQIWLDSAGHRKVLSTRAYRQIGLAAIRVPLAPGAFGGLDVTIVAADFGARS
jgi:uncharacterized protein YkwD